jgi:hypothetical protein
VHRSRNAPAGQHTEFHGLIAFPLLSDQTFLVALNSLCSLAALDADINATLAPGVKRFQAWEQLFSRHLAFLLTRHGSAPNQDILQARALIATNQAAKLLDARYATTIALADSVVMAYVQGACGVAASSKGRCGSARAACRSKFTASATAAMA